jgi:hypothetical protein
MLTLYTTGYKYSKKRCESVVEWFCKEYLKNYKIEVEVLHRGLMREGVYGWCDIVGENCRPRTFLIEIHNRLNSEDYIKTLLHELVHVQQYVLGDLKVKSSKRYYKGICMEDVEYENQGHEIEANGMEEFLYKEYLTHPQ